MTSAQLGHGWRIRLLAGSMFGLWLLVAARLVHIQHFQADELSARAKRQQSIEVQVPARPADIVDRNGNLLATTITTPSLFVDPNVFKVEAEFIDDLCNILDIEQEALEERLAVDTERCQVRRHVPGLPLPGSFWLVASRGGLLGRARRRCAFQLI